MISHLIKALMTLIIFINSSNAGNWSKAGKVHYEFSKLIESIRLESLPDRTEQNMIRSLSLVDASSAQYKVVTTYCELLVQFEYDQADPEKTIVKRFKTSILKGQEKECINMF